MLGGFGFFRIATGSDEVKGADNKVEEKGKASNNGHEAKDYRQGMTEGGRVKAGAGRVN